MKIFLPDGRREVYTTRTAREMRRILTKHVDVFKPCVIIRTVHAGRLRGIIRANKRVKDAVRAVEHMTPLHAPPILKITEFLEEQGIIIYYALDTTPYPQEPLIEIPLPHSIKQRIPAGGFHGWSHLYAANRARDQGWSFYLTLHTGSGSSLTAWKKKRIVWTSMPITPLHGIMGSTRSGMIDPGLVLWLVHEYGYEKAERILWKESGWQSISGERDFRRILEGKEHDPQARAINAYITSIAEQISIARVHLPRIDGIVFTGPITQYAWFRRRILRRAKCPLPSIYTPSREEEAIWQAWERIHRGKHT